MHLIDVIFSGKLRSAAASIRRPLPSPRAKTVQTGMRSMIVTVFRSRLNPGVQEAYGPMAKRMSELARTIPGYISHKGFVAEDGERVTIVEFESEEALEEWRRHAEHARAKRQGIISFFSEYSFQICNVIRDRAWTSKASRGASGNSAAEAKRAAEIKPKTTRRPKATARPDAKAKPAAGR
jgi:heme-degrading monooxygenase HmoA